MPNTKTVSLTVAGGVTDVTDANISDHVEVVNLDGGGEVWFTLNGTTPAQDGDGCYVLPAQVSSMIVSDPMRGPEAVVKLRTYGGDTRVHLRGCDRDGRS